MKRRLRVLVVMSHPEMATSTRAWIERCGYQADICPGFTDASTQLRHTPDLVIAEVRLGAFNGLHVAMRALWAGIPAIVMGPDDRVLRREAGSMGISYVTPDVHEQAMAALVDNLVTMRLARASTLHESADPEIVEANRPAAVA
jgi:DNA-binding response OmpR family regulator